ncbi:tyrosine-type recombinase/integrase [Dictyobacter formicarum]|uniref:Tyr recombinase domain-containing protein n=1 Tax=Dictyobacter formicarum TaxID=2778368 RepID=A0ABQ3VFX3_9CHLR|nr:tyrosine-type recombinase/integrase [Dictyobacter formicarum]GHO84371.1 hypothetical protein KSZ_23770 [Dictyobacter formicarum]
MGSRPSIIYETQLLLDSLMAIGQSRYQAKQELRRRVPELCWPVVTEQIYSYGTRKTYQQQTFAFVNWARANHGIKRLAQLYERLDELVCCYLREQITAQKSPYTLATQRSALRKVFGNHQLASEVVLPSRAQKSITRSRGPVKQDAHFQPTRWPDLILFARATGLRRAELRDLLVKEVCCTESGAIEVFVRNGKGGKARTVPVLADYADAIKALVQGRDPDEHVFEHIPKAMDVQSYRRASAQQRYLSHAPDRTLPPAGKRLQPTDYDITATHQVSRALGHERTDVVLNHYLR